MMSRMYIPVSEASSLRSLFSIDWSAGLDINCHGMRFLPPAINLRFGLSHLRNKRKQKQQQRQQNYRLWKLWNLEC